MNKLHPLYQEDLKYILSSSDLTGLSGKKILITGASGMIGVCLIDALMVYGNVEIFAVGRSKEKAKSRLGEYYDNPNFHFIEQDVVNPFVVNIKPDYIVIGASKTHPLEYSQQPIDTILTNVEGSRNALELATKCGATVLFLSSVEIYGNSVEKIPFNEDDTGKLNLSTARAGYTESKRLCEALCQSYIAERKLNVKIARLSRVFGPTMLMDDSKASSQFIKNALSLENVVLKSDGMQCYSYVYVADAVAALLCVLLDGENGKAYNISCDSCNVCLKDFAMICASFEEKKVIYDMPSEIEKKGYSIAHYALLCNDRLRNIGFEPRYDIRNGIFRTLTILS